MSKCIRGIEKCRTFASQKRKKELINDCFTIIKKAKKMKKLAFVFAAVVAVSFASCGNKTEQGACCDSDSVAVDSVVADSVVADSTVADSVVAE